MEKSPKERFLEDIARVVKGFELETGVTVKNISFETLMTQANSSIYPDYYIQKVELEIV